MQSDERFNVINRFLGYGDPSTASIIFIGIEEASSWSKENVERMLGQQSISKEQWIDAINRRLMLLAGSERTDQPLFLKRETYLSDVWSVRKPQKEDFKITEKMEVIMSLAIQRRNTDPLDYWLNHIDELHEMQSNLFPLGAKTVEHWPDFYPSIFDVPLDKDVYKAKCVANGRTRVLGAYLEEVVARNQNSWLILMGKEPLKYLKRDTLVGNVILAEREPVRTVSRKGKIRNVRYSIGKLASTKILACAHPGFFERSSIDEKQATDYYSRAIQTLIDSPTD